MIEFLVGLLVIFMIGIFALLGSLLLPLLLLMGFFMRFFIGLFLCLFVIWFIGKLTLLSIVYLRKREEGHKKTDHLSH